jgi:enamine deaminase RidA (YjgF/YER057c/UK114 family)
MSNIEERINQLGLTLPPPPIPVASYIPAKQSGNLVFTAGQLPVVSGALISKGLLGQDVDVDEELTLVKTTP